MKKSRKKPTNKPYLLLKFILNHQFVNFLFLNLWTLTKDLHISSQPARLTEISKPHIVMLLPLHPTENLLKISFWQPVCKHTLLSAASHRGFVRQACSEPRAFKTPLCSRTQRGRKSRSVFASHVGTQALYTLQWHCRYFVSLTNRKEACKAAGRSFGNWELYKFPNPQRGILSFFSPYCVFWKAVCEGPTVKVTNLLT